MLDFPTPESPNNTTFASKTRLPPYYDDLSIDPGAPEIPPVGWVLLYVSLKGSALAGAPFTFRA